MMLPKECVLELTSMGYEDILDAVRRLRPHEFDEASERMAEELLRTSQGDAFYLHDLLLELQRGDWALDCLTSYPTGLIAYLERWWMEGCRACKDWGPDSFGNLMSLLAVARSPLGREELLAFGSPSLSGHTVRVLLAAAGRYLLSDESGRYFLSHQRIKEFVLHETADSVEETRNRFADICKEWDRPSLPISARNYALRNGVGHLKEVGQIDAIPDLVSEAWLVSSRDLDGPSAKLVSDIDSAMECELTRTPSEAIVTRVVYLQHWKQKLQSEKPSVLLGAEQTLRARLGEEREAIAEVNRFGSDEDRLLVHTELFLKHCPSNLESAEWHMRSIEPLWPKCKGSWQEFVAMRLVEAAPDAAIRLVLKSEARLRAEVDLVTKEEWDSRPKCIARIFGAMASRDSATAMDMWTALESPSDRMHAGVAVASVLVRDLGGQARQRLDDIVSSAACLPGEEKIRFFLARYLFWRIEELPDETYIKSFFAINEIAPLFGSPVSWNSLLDGRIASNPCLWQAATRKMLPSTTRDFVYWRLLALGEIPPDLSYSFSSAFIESMVEALRTVGNAEKDPVEAARSGCGIDSPYAYAYAMAGLATLVKQRSERAAQIAIASAFDVVAREGDLGLPLGLMLLGPALRWAGPFRPRMLNYCVSRIKELGLHWDRLDAEAALGSSLAEAFCASLPDDAKFFQSVVSDFSKEQDRLLVAEILIRNLPEAMCIRVAEAHPLYGLAVGGKGNEDDNDLLAPESRSRLLAHLVEAISRKRPELASEMLEQAAEAFPQVDRAVDRDLLSEELTSCALRFRPVLAWEIFSRSACEPDVLIDAVSRVVGEKRDHRNDVRESWARLAIDRALPSTAAGGPVDWRGLSAQVATFESFSRHPSVGLVNPQSPFHTEEWFDEFAVLNQRFLERYGPSFDAGCLYGVAQGVIEIDLLGFMKLQRSLASDPIDDAYATSVISRALIGSRRPTEELLGCAREIRDFLTNKSMGVADSDDLGDLLLGWAASLDPQMCLEMIEAAHSSPARICKALRPVQNGASWRHEDLTRLWGSHIGEDGSDEDVVACSAMLAWLGPGPSAERFAQELCHRLESGRRSPETLYQVASHLEAVDPKHSAALLKKAMGLALSRKDARWAFKILVEARAKRADWDPMGSQSEGVGDDCVSSHYSWSNSDDFRAIMTPEEGLSLLTASDRLDIAGQPDLIAHVANLAASNRSQVNEWSAALRRYHRMDREVRKEITANIVSRGIERGIITDIQQINEHLETDQRINSYIQLAKRASNAEGRTILQAGHSEAERLDGAQDRATAFRALAEGWLERDRSAAYELYSLMVREAAREDNEFLIAWKLIGIGAACCDHPGDAMAEVASTFWGISASYPFEYRRGSDGKAWSLIESACASYTSDRPAFTARIREAMAEYGRFLSETSLVGRHSPCRRAIIYCCHQLQASRGSTAADDFLDEVFAACPSACVTDLADDLAAQCQVETGRDRAFVEYGLVNKIASEQCAGLLRRLTPLCSAQSAAVAHLALAMHEFGPNPLQARRDSDRAVETLEAIKGTAHKDLICGVWTLHALVHGLDGWIRAFREMNRVLPPTDVNLTGIIACALDSASDPRALVRRLFAAIYASKGGR
jgi:hypothetical protein